MSLHSLNFTKYFLFSLLTTLSLGTTALAATPDNQYESVEMLPYPIFMIPDASQVADLQDQQVQAAAYLFDRDINTAYSSAYPAQIVAPFGDLQTVNSLRIYGAAPFFLNIQAKQNDTWVPVKGLESIDLSAQPDQWNEFTATEVISTTELLLNLVPLISNPSGSLREIEFWVQHREDSDSTEDSNSTTEVATLPTSSDSSSQSEEVVKGSSKVAKAATVAPGLAKKISHEGAELEVNGTAVDKETTVSMETLDTELPELDAGMVNVTKGPRKGYRFGPHGMKFKNKIKVKLPYDKSLLPPGYTEQEIKTYYYDEELGRWQALERDSVDTHGQTVTSLTDHFTDMINSTVTVPESPETVAYSPTQIKDIKAIDPSAGIHLIEPPQANNMGGAGVSYPLEVPPGRAGMQPQLAVQYNSSGGNSWVGVGWDVGMQTVTIDTRWGVPRYDSRLETETYTLSGQQLTPLAHRGELQPRTAEKVFQPRIEGSFAKIIRHGNSPKNYSWEVTDKNGTVSAYGGDGATLADDEGNIFVWALREVKDTYGNNMQYQYEIVTDTGLVAGTVPGKELYLKTIHYTGYQNEAGPYQVKFVRDRDLGEAKRADVSIDARGGFKRVTADLLRKVEVSFNGQVIRSYELKYKEGAFKKTLLSSLTQYGENGEFFYAHTFEYYDESRDTFGKYKGFLDPIDWISGDDGVAARMMPVEGQASAVGGSTVLNINGHLYIGIGTIESISMGKKNTGGPKIGFSNSDTEGLLAQLDINGDSLPDKVYKKDDQIYYRPNLAVAGKMEFGEPQVIASLPELSKETSRSFSWGVEGYLFSANGGYNNNTTFTETTIYFADVNSDGLVDLVKNGQVLFNHLNEQGHPFFSKNSADTPYPLGTGSGIDTNGIMPDYEDVYQQAMDKFPLADTVRRWVVPYDGLIQIQGEVALIEDTSRARQRYETADGVRVAIQHNDIELWSTRIEATDYTPRTPTGLESLTVKKGDLFYFRVQSVKDGAYDQVSWKPTIQYLGVSPLSDVNQLAVYQYDAATDFSLYGHRDMSTVGVPFAGEIRIVGELQKGITTDDVTLWVYQNDRVVYQKTLAWNEVTTLALNELLTVAEKDSLRLWVQIDSSVDLNQVKWNDKSPPKLFYVSSPKLKMLTDAQGNPVVQTDLLYHFDVYPQSNFRVPLSPWRAPKTATYTVTPLVAVQEAIADQLSAAMHPLYSADNPFKDELMLTVKRRGELVAKHKITVDRVLVRKDGYFTVVTAINNGSFTLDVQQDEELFFELSSRDVSLPELTQASVMLFTPSEVITHTVLSEKIQTIPETTETTTEATEGQENNSEKPETWKIPETGRYIIETQIMTLPEETTANGTVTLKFNGISEEPLTQEVTIVNGVVNNLSFEINAVKDAELSFATDKLDPELAKRLSQIQVAVFATTQHSVLTTYATQWNVAQAGTYRLNPQWQEVLAGTTINGEIGITVINSSGEETQHVLTVQQGQITNVDFSLQMAAGDELRFDFSQIDPDLAPALSRYALILEDTPQHRVITEATDLQVPVSGTYTINSLVATLPGDKQTNETIALSVEKGDSVLASSLISIANGVVSNTSVTFAAEDGDRVQLKLERVDESPGDPFSLLALPPLPLSALPLLQTALEIVIPDVAGYAVPVELHTGSPAQLMAEPYRGWNVFGYQGNRERAEQPIVILPTDGMPNGDDYEEIDADDLDPAKETDINHPELKVFPFYAQPSQQRWKGIDDNAWAQAGILSSSRNGQDNIEVPRPTQFAGAQAVSRIANSSQDGLSLGVSIVASVSAAKSNGTTVGVTDFMDLNGDRFPDILGEGGVQYTNSLGGLEPERRRVLPYSTNIRESTSDTVNYGIGGTFPVAEKKGSRNLMASLGINASVTSGETDTNYDLDDLNGDGLPDRVIQRDGQIFVAFNLGYRFAPQEKWSDSNIYHSEDKNASISGSIDSFSMGDGSFSYSYNDDVYGLAGGISLTCDKRRTYETLMDINGDGLSDAVTMDHDDFTINGNSCSIDSNSADKIRVKLNTGNGFAPEIAWPLSLPKGLSVSSSSTLNGGLYFTIPLPLGLIRLAINPGADLNYSMNRPEIAWNDIDGDGYADYLYSTRDSELKVARNPIGRTNLLKNVKRPLGATFTIEYQRQGNTYKQPSSSWVMSRVTVHDGHAGDGVDTLVSTYRYENGFYHRQERDFYGYETVVSENRDTADQVYRTVTQTFYNDSYYNKGLLRQEVMTDAAGKRYSETETTYLLQNVNTGQPLADLNDLTATVFPMSVRVDKRFYEGQEQPGKTTYETYQYDAQGNVIQFFDAGDAGTADDVEAVIGYFNNPDNHITKPQSIVITHNGTVLRQREANFDATTGAITEVRQYLADGRSATANITYDQYGNIHQLAGPANYKGQRYSLNYRYDDQVHTYNVTARNSFGETSKATYNLKYGQVETTTDVNQQPMVYTFDAFGRTATITGPYEAGKAPYTIRFEYHPDATVPWSLTQHFDAYRKDPLETVLFTDGLKRVIQTKKDATVHQGVSLGNAREVMTVSGHVVYDFLGRAIEQYYPVTEPLGNAGVFNSQVDNVQPTRLTYDAIDRTLTTVLPDNTSTRTEYGFGLDRAGQLQFLTRAIDANGQVKESYTDVNESVTAVKEFNDGQAIWTSYEYDPLNQIVKVLDDHNNLTTAIYDNLGRRTHLSNPDTGLVETVYDLASNVTQKITANLRADGKAIQYDYDYNRLMKITYPHFAGNNVTYTYGKPGADFNRVGRVVMVTDQSGSEESFYGPLGEVVKTVKIIASETGGQVEKYITEYEYDTWNRLRRLVYPDGEVLINEYDSGGLLNAVFGDKAGNHYQYVTRLEYDQFEQRAFVQFGNGTQTTYEYAADNRRLMNLQAGKGGKLFQDLTYQYDPVGNILGQANRAKVTSPSEMGGATQYQYVYDDLYRLTHANGTFERPHERQTYTLDMGYDSVHNILSKVQYHDVAHSDKQIVQNKTTYNWNYAYQGSQPHAPTHIGQRTFAYDANGNQTGWTHDENGTQRAIVWDEENRIQSVSDGGQETTFKYNASGERVLKRGAQGETAYVNQFFVIRNGAVASKHVYAGSSRVVSKLVMQESTSIKSTLGLRKKEDTSEKTNNQGGGGTADARGQEGNANNDKACDGNGNSTPAHCITHPPEGTVPPVTDTAPVNSGNNGGGNGNNPSIGGGQAPNGNNGGGNGNSPSTGGGQAPKGPEEKQIYFYHPDHLGSTSYVTDTKGAVSQHVEYFAFGETFVAESSNTQRASFGFTGKELDEETGLYYFGARYFDARTSVWVSPDPILDKYLPTGDKEKDKQLPGMGGVFNSFNLGLYSYTHLNPVKFVDPDGNEPLTKYQKTTLSNTLLKLSLDIGERTVNEGTKVLSPLFGKVIRKGIPGIKIFFAAIEFESDKKDKGSMSALFDLALDVTPGVDYAKLAIEFFLGGEIIPKDGEQSCLQTFVEERTYGVRLKIYEGSRQSMIGMLRYFVAPNFPWEEVVD